MVRIITDRVVALTQKYNGLLWGEHGKGVRSEYAPAFFGELYPQIQRIKAIFDPRNQLNPGKIATPAAGIPLLKIDEVTTRGQIDRKIPVQIWSAYHEAVHCNGNGLCYNWNPNDSMCPSWKATRERIHSPKGRASLMREWLKQLSDRGVDPLQESAKIKQRSFLLGLPARINNTLNKRKGDYDFSHQVNDAMQGCLACKSCVGQCPIKVDVPEFRAKFLELYYGRYLRPLKDYFVGSLETLLPWMAKAPWLYNLMMKPEWVKKLMARGIGMVDSPLLTGINLSAAAKKMSVAYASLQTIAGLTDEEKSRSVIVVQDAFTSYFETQMVIDVIQALKKLNFIPLIAPFKPNGKALHVHGFLSAFNKTADANATYLNGLASAGIPLIGIDPAMTLTYRFEYKKILGNAAPNVLLIQEWLVQQLSTLDNRTLKSQEFYLLAHCTEKTNAISSLKQWQDIFKALGHQLTVIDTGCCGMSGTFGHEAANYETSKTIFAMSWQKVLAHPERQGRFTATGYSCRSQVKRLEKRELPHPLQLLLQHMSE